MSIRQMRCLASTQLDASPIHGMKKGEEEQEREREREMATTRSSDDSVLRIWSNWS